MPYIGQPPVSGDTTKSFRLLDNLASFTLSFDATSSSVVDTTANTLTFANHRFVTAQRVTYSDGGGTAIGGLTDGTAYFIIKVDQNTIQLASSASNANNGTAISLSSGAVGSHTLNLAFDGTNTKFKATYANGTKAKISRAGQLLISINGVLQQAQESSTPTLGFGLDSDSTIVFSQAPVSTDVLFGQILADTITNFDTQDNTLDVFTGDGSTTTFNLSKKPASNNDILVTLDGVVQYPTTTSTSNAYSVTESTLTFTAAPADGVAIQVRHIGFAGATSSAVTGLYGRTGNVTLSSSDDDITVGNVTAGIITATSYGSISGTTASFSGNVSIGGTLTYEDVTNIDAVGLITARSGVKFGASGTTVQGTSTGIGIGTDTPGSILEAHGSGATIHAKTAGATNARVRITAGNAQSSFLEFADTDDSDVGEIVYSHSNNNMRFVTAATERMRLDGGGRLLIGHDSSVGDDNNLQLVGTTADGSSATFWRSSNDNGNPQLNFVKTRGTVSSPTVVQDDDTLGVIRFYGWDGNDSDSRGAQITAQVDGTPGGDDMPGRLIFATTSDGSRIPTERMRIDKSGQLMLGTTTSTNLAFTVFNDTNSAALFQNSNTGTGSGNGFYVGTSTGTDTYVWNYENASLRFATNNAEAMRIDSSGRLLIGTTTEGVSGGDQLTIAASAHSGMTIRAGTSSRSSIYMSDGTSGADEYRGYIEYDHASNYMRFGTNAAQQMRIDSSGRLLVGLTSFPDSDAFVVRGNANDDNEAFMSLVRGSAPSSNQNLGMLRFHGNGNQTEAARITVLRDGGTWTAGSSHPGRLVFSTTSNSASSPTERLRIDSDGYQASTSTNNGIEMGITAAASALKIIFRGRHSATAGSYATGTVSFNVWANGDVQNINNSYTAISDITLKENIVPASSQWDNIKDIEVVNYNFREETGHETYRQLGVIAQQVEEVSPGLVKDGEEGLKTVNYSVLYMKAVKALQEAQTRIETLETQQSDLLSRVAALEG